MWWKKKVSFLTANLYTWKFGISDVNNFPYLYYFLFFHSPNRKTLTPIFLFNLHRKGKSFATAIKQINLIFIVPTCQSAMRIPTNHKKECERPPSCPTNMPADRMRSQFVTRDGFALCVGNMQCRWEISRRTKWRTIYFVPQAEDGARKMQAMDKKLRKTARTAKLGTRKQT